MQERDALALGSDAGCFVDEGDAGRAAAIERRVEIVDGEGDVVDAGSALVEEPADGSIGVGRLEQFDERIACAEAGDVGAVGIGQWRVGQAEHVAVEGEQVGQFADGNANVRDSGWTHGITVVRPRRVRQPRRDPIIIHGGVRLAMSNAIAVTDADFEAQVEKNSGVTVVDFWATWCGPCRMIAPILEQLSVEYEGKVRVTKLDVDSNQRTAMRFNVRSIPTLLFFKDGKVVDQVIGAVPKAALAAKFQQHAA